jgi:hypothetical protein
MQTTDIPMTQRRSHVEITNEKNAYQFPRYQEYCSHFEFIPQSQTIIQAHYVEILKWLREVVQPASSAEGENASNYTSTPSWSS